jgi:hypothetical protein
MKFLNIFLLILTLVFPSLGFSDTYSAQICSTTTTVCADIQSDLPFTTKSEGRFELKLEDNKQSEINLVKIDLWMQMGNHGHGSSPLKVLPLATNQFDVTNAYFVMRGTWQIRITYRLNNFQETLILPTPISE